jgi:hypothetical protein
VEEQYHCGSPERTTDDSSSSSSSGSEGSSIFTQHGEVVLSYPMAPLTALTTLTGTRVWQPLSHFTYKPLATDVVFCSAQLLAGCDNGHDGIFRASHTFEPDTLMRTVRETDKAWQSRPKTTTQGVPPPQGPPSIAHNPAREHLHHPQHPDRLAAHSRPIHRLLHSARLPRLGAGPLCLRRHIGPAGRMDRAEMEPRHRRRHSHRPHG